MLGLVAVVAALPAHAATDAGFGDLDHTLYTAQQGAPSAINALAQTPDGLLWIGTSEGLYRFDGAQFRRYRQPDGHALPDTDIVALLALPSGALWAATRFGRVYAIEANGVATTYGVESGLPAHSLFGLARDRAGRLWTGGSAGVFRLTGGRWEEVKARDGRSLHLLSMNGLLADPEDRLWVVSAESGVFCLEPGAAAFDKRRDTSAVSGSMLVGPRGEAWIADDRGVTPLAGAPGQGIDARTLARLGGDGRGTPVMRFLDRQGVLWGYSDGRLLRLPCPACSADAGQAPASGEGLPQVQRFPRDRELSGTQFQAFFEDREGNLWVGSSGGLDKFHPNKFRQALADGQPLADVALAEGADGTLYAGTYAHGLYRRAGDGRFVREPFGKADDTFITALHVGRDGTLWIGGDGELHRSSGSGYVAVPFAVGDDVNYEIQGFAEDAAGGLWVSATLAGLYRFADGAWTRNGGLAGLPDETPLVMASGEQGSLWLGYVGGVVRRVQAGRVQRFDEARGLAVGNILALLPDGPRTWVGGTTGLAVIVDDAVHPVPGPAGEPLTGVSGIVRDTRGDLWLNGADGVTRLPAGALDALLARRRADVAWETFGAHAGIVGLPENLRPLPTALRTRTGELWFATTGGLFHADPGRLPRNDVPPQPRIVAVRADGQAHAASAAVALPQGARALEIDYTAASLVAPDLVRFRYRLEGSDAGWQEAGNRRQAFYTNLPPGDYTFRVQATNEDGVAGTTEATLAIAIPAAFWQTRWFTAAAVLTAILAAWTLHRVRLHVLGRRVRVRFEERLQERERIARELHDTLLQGTQGLVLGIQVTAGKLPPSDPRRQEMEAMLDHADQVVAEARDRVHELRSPEQSGEDLVTALTAVGSDLAARSKAQFDVETDADLPPLRHEMQGEAFMAAREALLNAFKHAGASAVTLEVRRESRLLRIVVRDDGRGIDAAVLARGSRPGHWGLVGMRERLEKLGGRLRLHSDVGGTEVRLEWPAAMAFAAPALHGDGRWRALLRLGRRGGNTLPA